MIKTMKLFKHEAKEVVRVRIAKDGYVPRYITLSGTTQDEFLGMCRVLFKDVEPQHAGEKVTNIQARRAVGRQNLEAESYSFRGFDPDQAYDVIINEINRRSQNKAL